MRPPPLPIDPMEYLLLVYTDTELQEALPEAEYDARMRY